MGSPAPSSASPPRAGLSAWIAAGALVCLAAIHYRHGQDFVVFWRAGRRFLAGEDLFPVADGFLVWRYAPGTALLFSPFAFLPLWLAKAVWFALMVAAGALSVRTLASGARDWRPGVLALLALSRPLVEEFACGQVNLMVLLAALLAFREEDEGRRVRSGLLLAIAVGLKLSPALLLLDPVLRRRWGVLAGAALGAVLIAAAPLPFYGLDGTVGLHRLWMASLAAASPGAAAAGGNQSVFGFTSRIGAPPWLGAVAAAGLVALALRRPAPEPRRGLLLFATAIASPMGWLQNYVMALPALHRVACTGRRRVLLAVGLSLLLPMYDVSGPRFERWFFDHSLPFAAMVLFFALAAGLSASQPGSADEMSASSP